MGVREKKMKKTFRTIIVCICIITCCISFAGCRSDKNQTLEEKIEQTAKSMQKMGPGKELLGDESLILVGDAASDWIAMTLAFSDQPDAYDTYLKDLEAYVVEQYETNGYIHQVKATEYHRIALTMLALGGDPAAVLSDDKTINLVADGTYDFTGGSPGLQGSNGLIYSLMVLDAMDYQVPEDEQYGRKELIAELLTYQQPDGGFVLDMSVGSDIDITAMAIQALASYQDQEEVKTAIDQALAWLSDQMSADGSFSNYGEACAESCAQVILALCAVGEDPEMCEQFQKEGNVMDAMDGFRMKDGMYQHVKDEEDVNIMATYQALLALEAVDALRSQDRWIFDFQSYTAPQSK